MTDWELLGAHHQVLLIEPFRASSCYAVRYVAHGLQASVSQDTRQTRWGTSPVELPDWKSSKCCRRTHSLDEDEPQDDAGGPCRRLSASRLANRTRDRC